MYYVSWILSTLKENFPLDFLDSNIFFFWFNTPKLLLLYKIFIKSTIQSRTYPERTVCFTVYDE